MRRGSRENIEPLRPRPTVFTLLAAGLLLAAAACGPAVEPGAGPAPAEASGEPAAGASSAEEPGLLASIFDREPSEVRVPAGTVLTVRFEETLSSHDTPVGQAFAAVVTQEVSVDGELAVPAGSVVHGTVSEASPPRKVGGRARLGLAFERLELPDGEEVPIEATFAQAGRSETPKDAAIIAGSTLGGAILGEAVDEGEGTVVGAIVGGVAGAIGAAKTKGKPVVVPAGTAMSIELTQGVTVPL